MKKRALSAALAVMLCLAFLPAPVLAAESMDNFKQVEQYPAGIFTDVAAGSWYAGSVQAAYELGLVKGSSDTTVSPEGRMTVGSALALACRLHSIYATGGADFAQGTPWYAVYVDYAVKNGIITQSQFVDYNANATRREFAEILGKAMPKTALAEQNTVPDGAIPDVAVGSAAATEIYCLYRAGVLTGNDKYGTFAPESTIDRASVATIAARMAQPSLRQQVKLEPAPVAVSGVTLDKTSLALGVGGSAILTATVTPENATDRAVIWSSSKPTVATVSGGTVTGVANGTAVITAATANGVTAICTVEVTRVGTRSNPLPADGGTAVPYNEYSFNPTRQVKVECTGVLAGADANAVVDFENSNNKVPGANQEWRVYDFTLTYVSTTGGDDDALEASDIIYDDTFFTTSGSSVTVADKGVFTYDLKGQGVFDVKLYPGSSGRVVVSLLVPKDQGDFLLQVPSSSGKANTWLLCAPSTAGALTNHSALNGGGSSGNNSGNSSGNDSGSSSGSDADNDGKFSYSDAMALNRAAELATEDVIAGMGYCNDFFGASSILRVLHLKQAIASGLSAARDLSDALNILNNRVESNLTSGQTLRELVQGDYNLLMTLENIEVTADNGDTAHEEIWDIITGVNTIGFHSLAIKMLEAF